MKIKCAILGNCQAEALPNYLIRSQKFSSLFDVLELPGIYTLPPSQFFDTYADLIYSADILIYQPLSEKFGLLSSDNIKKYVKPSCQFITIPSLFFTGYNPEVAYVRDKDLRTLDYIDRIFWRLWTDGVPHELPDKLNDLTYFPLWFSEACVKASLQESRQREIDRQIVVKMTDFIENRFQEHRLFHVLNHPSAITMVELANRILNVLSVDDRISISDDIDEGVMKNFSFPIYSSHHKNLMFKFDVGHHNFFGEMPVSKYIDVFSARLSELSDDLDVESLQFDFGVPESRADNHIIGEMESELIFKRKR
jgi:hypothetical protein